MGPEKALLPPVLWTETRNPDSLAKNHKAMSKNKTLISVTIALFLVAGVVIANAQQAPPKQDPNKLRKIF